MMKTWKRYNSYMYFSLVPIIFLYLIALAIAKDTFCISKPGLLVCVSICFLMSTVMMINAYVDREIDKIAHPERALPSGNVSLNEAKVLIAVMAAGALGFSLLCGYVFVFVTELSLILVYILVCILKRTKVRKNKLYGVIYFILAPSFISACFLIISYCIIGKCDIYLVLCCATYGMIDIGHDVFGCIKDKEGDESAELATIIKIFGEKVCVGSLVLFDIAAFVLSCIYGTRVLEGISLYLHLGIGAVIAVLLVWSDINYLAKQDEKSSFLARECHNFATYGWGLLLIVFRLSPHLIFGIVGAALFGLNAFSSISAVKSNQSYLK